MNASIVPASMAAGCCVYRLARHSCNNCATPGSADQLAARGGGLFLGLHGRTAAYRETDGTLHAVLARPIRRLDFVLGRWLARRGAELGTVTGACDQGRRERRPPAR